MSFGVLNVVDAAFAQPSIPTHEWSSRHPPPAANRPAFADTAIGSGTNNEHVYSVYHSVLGEGESVITIVKYNLNGTIAQETQWPSDDEPPGWFVPRAMSVLFTAQPPRTDICIVGDIPTETWPHRRIVTLVYSQNLEMRWMYVHGPYEKDIPALDQGVAIAAVDGAIAVVGRMYVGGQDPFRWQTTVFNRYGTASYLMPPQYCDPSSQEDWPVAISLSNAAQVAVLGAATTDTGSMMRALLYEVDNVGTRHNTG